MQALILAGGFGTRLQTLVNDVPKALAPIGNKPFLFWLITYFQKQGITSFVFSLGYLHVQIQDYLKKNLPDLSYECVVENEPLGTGGAIRKALTKFIQEDIIIANGDTFFKLNINEFVTFYKTTSSDCCIALKQMQNFDRYGCVKIDAENNITQFCEKKHISDGLISTGIFILNKNIFLEKTKHLPQKFSYEKDFFEPNIANLKVTGYISDEYFIDIGIPEDYLKANSEIERVVNKK